MNDNHEVFMREAIALSAAAKVKGNAPFGAVLVRDGEIVLRAENERFTSGDVTNHAEVNLIRQAVNRFGEDYLTDCTLYASGEPCAMCAGTIYWAGISRLVFGISVERLAAVVGATLDVPCRTVFAGCDRDITVIGPVLEDEAARVFLA